MKNLLFALMALLAIVVLPACKSERSADEVAQKIEKGEKLDQKDYGVMLDYVTPAVEELVKFIEMGADEHDIMALNKQYPLADKFLPLLQTEEPYFDAANQEKARKISQLYLRAYEIAAKKQGVDLSQFNDELPEDLPGFSQEANEHTPAD